jgi:hypothetical protein
VCSPEWLAEQTHSQGIVDVRHHLVVNVEAFNEGALRRWLQQRVSAVEAAAWPEVAQHLGRLGHWEFEDYRP